MVCSYGTIEGEQIAEGIIVKKQTLRSSITVLVAVLLLVISPTTAFAATTTAKKVTTAPVNTETNTLKISPVRTDLAIDAGAKGTVTMHVFNITNAPIEVNPIENDFVAGPEENGTPAIILSPTQYAPTHSLKRFMQPLPSTLTVPANNSIAVTLTIAVPKSAQAGGYFGAIRFAPASTAGSKQVNLSPSIASLILMTVPGPAVQSVGITNFDIEQDGSTGTNFRNSKNLSLFIRFQNKGNLQEAPFGQIYVQKGKKTVYSYNFNENQPQDEILPDSYRRWSFPLHGIGSFGKYTVGAALTYGTGTQQSIDITKTVWIIPTVLIYSVIAGVVALIIIITLIWMALRSYKKRILRGSHHRRY